jgi:hypothetical protein
VEQRAPYAGRALDMDKVAIKREWRLAKAWLFRELRQVS